MHNLDIINRGTAPPMQVDVKGRESSNVRHLPCDVGPTDPLRGCASHLYFPRKYILYLFVQAFHPLAEGSRYARNNAGKNI